MFRVGSDGEHGFGAGFEQQVVDHGLVVIGDVGDLAWQGEHHVEIGHRQQLGLALGEPVSCGRPLAFGTMPVTATVEGDGDLRTVFTAGDMATERRRAAALDRAHHLELAKADMPGISGTPAGPMVAEDIRDLQGWTGHPDRRLSARPVTSSWASSVSWPRSSAPTRGRAGFRPWRSCWWRPGCSARSRPIWRDRARPG